ncbi:MAG TPA: hypothetical protein VJ111_12885 [Chitinophagaceae bacterium]|nr:hypothetical protein [Chitinophagaceae bacterium]
MHSKQQKKKSAEEEDLQLNADWQGVDKAPGEEKGKKEKVTKKDLKGKKVDADPEKESDKPAG